MIKLDTLTPEHIVKELDRYIIGQERAKRIVAIALRNRTRRIKLPESIRDEVSPKNIIMIGPTGVGKTEVARRIAKLTDAPFIKVEATKYTEVGYVGRDVESMIRDLMTTAIAMVKADLKKNILKSAQVKAEQRLLKALLPGTDDEQGDAHNTISVMLKQGALEEKEIEIEVSKKQNPIIEVSNGSHVEGLAFNMNDFSSLFGNKKSKRKITIKKAREIFMQEESENLIDGEQVTEIAKERVEQYGIVFIDEIDKIASPIANAQQNISREGVQRDILPIIEGSSVQTRYGAIDTTHILFIAAGAFHAVKPSDLIPELQGRFPLRVELNDLTQDDFNAILTKPQNALIKQYCLLLETEEVKLQFSKAAIKRIAAIAVEINNKTDNIGARRLHTIMEILLEEISFNAPQLKGQTIPITAQYVDERLTEFTVDTDLSRYIL